MSDDTVGWREVGVFEEGTLPAHEEALNLDSHLDCEHRTVDVHGEDTYLEIEVETGERWVRVAEFTHRDPHDVALHFEDTIESEDYRVASVIDGAAVIEKRVSDDD